MSTAGNNRSHQERLMMEALDIINGARRKDYGPPERNFQRIASLWNGYLMALGAEAETFVAIDVCHMLDLVKLARLVETPDHEDSIRDRFGYQGCYVDLVYGDKPVVEAQADELIRGQNEEWQDWPPAEPVWTTTENARVHDWPPAVEPVVEDVNFYKDNAEDFRSDGKSIFYVPKSNGA